MFIFGAGDLYAVPLIDANGNAIANPSPIRVATLQEMSLDFSGDIKELYGQNQFAVAVARGKVKITGKAKGATINGAGLNSLFFGQTMTAGTQQGIFTDNVGTAIPTTPFQITPTAPFSGTVVADMGVVMNGVPMTRVASGPVTGQYIYAAGVYTFATADSGQIAFISYQWSATLAGSKRIQISNLPMGAAPSFKCFFVNQYAGKRALSILYSAVASKLGYLATKLDDFNIPEFDFTGQQDTNGNVADIYLSE